MKAMLPFSTQVPAVLGGSVLEYCPYALCTDITPIQYDAMSEYYDHKPEKNDVIGTYKYRTNIGVFNNAAYIVPWSNLAKQSLVNDYGASLSKVTIVPVGVDTEVGNVQQLFDYMYRLIADPELRRNVGKYARQHVDQYFNAQKM